jgi:GNAT superfamily N-acetyltransferase
VHNSVFAEYPDTEEDWRHEDAHHDPKIRWGRFVAEEDGRLVGLGGYSQFEGSFHPQKFYVYLNVRPEQQGRGLGQALYDTVLAAISPFDPIQLNADTREDITRGVAFAERNGFREKLRSWESRLDLATFDPTPFRAEAQRAHDAGIRIRTFAELAADTERERKMYDLSWELVQDVPSTDPPTRLSFENYVNERLHHPDFMPEGCFIALDGTDYIGYTNFWRSKAGAELYTGLTGVKRSHRRRGIAMALKLGALEWAQAQGVPRVKTWNEQNNVGMLSINMHLGFVKQPAWISYVKVLDDAAPAEEAPAES